MFKPISQNDPRWRDTYIGQSRARMSRWGCTISSICMALEDMRGVRCNPSDACRFWTFNSKGEILWIGTQFRGARFIWRGYGFDESKVYEYRKDKNKAVIVEVRAPGIPRHWVYYADDVICDPLDGSLHKVLPAGYKPIGYALFASAPVEPSPWAKEFVEKAYKKGLKMSSPFTRLDTTDKVESALLEMGLIDKAEGVFTLERFVTIVDKISERW